MSMHKPKRPVIFFALVGVAALSLAAALVATPGHGRPGDMGPMAERFLEHRFERLAEYLELTAAQRAEAEVLRERWFGNARERHQTMAASFERIHEMAGAENPDTNAIGELVIQMHREREAMKAAHEGHRAELEKLLTPEQAEKLEAWEAARSWDEGFGPHRRHGRFHRAPHRSPDAD